MHSMAIDRKTFLRGGLAMAAWPLLPPNLFGGERELFAAALREPGGEFAAAIFSLEHGEMARVALPARGHAFAVQPASGACVAFARRPGTFAVAFDAIGAKAPLWFAANPGRHFYGHGVFSNDGRLLYSTENDFERKRGMIGVRDATDGSRQIGEFSSGGIGPHDIALLRDGRTLVVANGGIETHPGSGRSPLNLATMTPSLVYIDTQSGDVLERHELTRDLYQLSIRHIAVTMSGDVVFGCQFNGPRNERPALVGFHKRGERLRLADIPQAANGLLKGYVGSICVDRSGEIVAATSPKGGVVLYFDVAGKRLLGSALFGDASGVAGRAHSSGFIVTSGEGRIATASPGQLELLARTGTAWDNHAALL